MNAISKRLAALLTSLLLVFTLTACTTDVTYITQYNDIKVPTGVYVSGLLRALNQAAQSIPSNSTDPWAETLEDKPLEQWVSDEAHDTVRLYVAVHQMAQEQGVTLSEEDTESVASLANLMTQYYAYYANNDVTQADLEAFIGNQFLLESLFGKRYGVGGDREISADEVERYYLDHYIRMRTLTFSKYGSDGNLLEGDALKDYEELVQAYLDAAQKNPDQMDALIQKYNAYYTSISQGIDDENAQNPLPTADSLEGNGTPENKQELLDRNNQGSYPAELLEMIAELPYGEPTLLEFQGTDLIAVNYELSAEDEELAQNDDMIRFMLKGEEFTQELTELGASYNLAFNGAATRKYTPKTLKFE